MTSSLIIMPKAEGPVGSYFALILAILIVMLYPTIVGAETNAEQHTDNQELLVDFRYSLPWWVTSICLPDDPHKTLVAKNGDLLYDYGGKFYGANGRGGFKTTVGVTVSQDAKWLRQELVSPRVPIVKTIQSAPGLDIVQEAFAVTDPPGERDCDRDFRSYASRNDVIFIHVTNTSETIRTIAPQIIIKSQLPIDVDLNDQQATINKRRAIISTLELKSVDRTSKDKRTVQLESMKIQPGRTQSFAVTYAAGYPVTATPKTVEQVKFFREKAIDYWNNADLPNHAIEVPDGGIQALLDSSIRNIWQAREIKRGLPAFQVGPTCYRGLWIVDGAFILETATMLGKSDEARSGIEYMLSFQKPSGAFEKIPSYYKENGIVLWAVTRHAFLTQDKEWLAQQWPKLQKAFSYIKILRRQASLNPKAPDYKLIPAGFIDGGLSNRKERKPEYTNTLWNLAGIKAAVKAARWLGKNKQADQWQAEYDDFYLTFRKTAKLDMCTDPHGNVYLPTMMGNFGNHLPQRAQWAFCHTVYPGQVFDKTDPLVIGNLNMLQATEQEEMVFGTGWVVNGIWNYFASFYGHAWLWQGNGPKAARCLYAMANHAAPMLAWREEQGTREHPLARCGDMPHNWASAEFIRLAVHLLALDRENELHLLEGLPAEWTKPGMATRLNGILTPFGPLDMSLKVADDGKTTNLKVAANKLTDCEKIVIHLDTWTKARGTDALRSFAPARPIDMTIPLE
ncbi:MAG: glucosidase family protein [Planctomycetota bacterium]|jgi:hypothetical protein